jgi:hypothetical protein
MAGVSQYPCQADSRKEAKMKLQKCIPDTKRSLFEEVMEGFEALRDAREDKAAQKEPETETHRAAEIGTGE